jgi:hypothetical protein
MSIWRLKTKVLSAMWRRWAQTKSKAELPSGKGADHASPAADLAHDALQRAVRAQRAMALRDKSRELIAGAIICPVSRLGLARHRRF